MKVELSNRPAIIWAVDPFGEDKTLIVRALRAARMMSGGGREIEPVYLADSEARVPALTLEEIRAAGQKAIDSAISGERRGERLRPLRVLGCPGVTSLRERVDGLVQYARSTEAPLVVVSTRSVRGPRRWVLGSFAETLSLRSDVPLLAVNPNWVRGRTVPRILFATDFSPQSREAYGRVVELAVELGCPIVLYHRFSRPPLPGTEYAPIDWEIQEAVYREALESKRGTAEEWRKMGEKQGAEVSVKLDTRSKGSLVESILANGGSRSGLLALASSCGPFAAALPGSTTRGVLRGARLPVWVLHCDQPARFGREGPPLFTISQGEIERQLFDKREPLAG